MAEKFLTLSKAERREALLVAAERSGRPAYLLEKDVWVVWTLNELFEAPFGPHLVFKGGTSLSKAYNGLIKRFSEDIDLTYDIRELIPELVGDEAQEPIPSSRSKAGTWSDAVRKKLPGWIAENVTPVLEVALERDGLKATITQTSEKLELRYDPVTDGASYVAPAVLLEFGARSSGEPSGYQNVSCDAARTLPDLAFPIATPRVMAVERTFWEKATAAHVYCLKGNDFPSRYARHWYDLAQLSDAGVVEAAIANRELALQVARHKQRFFLERDANGNWIDYEQAIGGLLRLVPEGEARRHLEDDYTAMLEGGLIEEETPMTFAQLMRNCEEIERMVNTALQQSE